VLPVGTGAEEEPPGKEGVGVGDGELLGEPAAT
jgi:hypothetical protein